jgi:dTDP-4-amino-4,6-dideoxygalactose transaminase
MVRLSDPGAMYASRRIAVDAAMARVAESGRYILGAEVEGFEREFAEYIGVPFAFGVGSGTDAIEIALRACGVRPGDLVYTVSHTAVATVAAIVRCGGVPVLVDVDPMTLTMQPDELERALRQRSGLAGRARAVARAVVPVHLYGCPADMPAILEVSRQYGLYVVEDSAQAHGAALDGRRLGGWGDISAFSFYPTKNLGAMGDGGMVLCSDPELATSVRRLRQYGWEERNVSTRLGVNSRLDELQAAILRVHLPHLDADNDSRREHAATYDRVLAGTTIIPPAAGPTARHVYHQYVVRTTDRPALQHRLRSAGIESDVHYPVPCHLQPGYRSEVAVAGGLEVTERAAREVLSVPVHAALSYADVQGIARALCSASGPPCDTVSRTV